MERIVKILSKEELDKRYVKLANTRMEKLTKKAISLDYSIAYIKQPGLHHSTFLAEDTREALESIFPKTSGFEIFGYTDISELATNDTVYCAFKEFPNGYGYYKFPSI